MEAKAITEQTFYANGQGLTWTQHLDLIDPRNIIISRSDGLNAKLFTHSGVRIKMPDGSIVEKDFLQRGDAPPNLYPLSQGYPDARRVTGEVRWKLAECLDAHYPANKPSFDPHRGLYM